VDGAGSADEVWQLGAEVVTGEEAGTPDELALELRSFFNKTF
jgi:hypothetical protein